MYRVAQQAYQPRPSISSSPVPSVASLFHLCSPCLPYLTSTPVGPLFNAHRPWLTGPLISMQGPEATYTVQFGVRSTGLRTERRFPGRSRALGPTMHNPVCRYTRLIILSIYRQRHACSPWPNPRCSALVLASCHLFSCPGWLQRSRNRRGLYSSGLG